MIGGMTEAEARALLRQRRVTLTKELVEGKRQLAALAAVVEGLEEQLRDVRHAEGILGPG